ncbi:hypothetical protein G3495_21785 [Shewanella baltica]|uniref:DUF5908 family protein n=1 Tax=Shewanella baltica TaxID=62322 RepID=UPI00217E2701|nr:DUF5908 family protein [Shewanella baltica]MCS6237710.1 hypothetical protein [Shewanella baltica]MCS6258929.1 hypothetical protein [Shewanella baltica]MCS6272287.1 hypothetical protein [Shewanella baltica]
MPVEIRELIIKTNITSHAAREEKSRAVEQSVLSQKIVQDCLKVLKKQPQKTSFDR